MLPYDDEAWYDEDGYRPAERRDPDDLDWGVDFDDLDAADWEEYLGGPDDAVFESWPGIDDGDD